MLLTELLQAFDFGLVVTEMVYIFDTEKNSSLYHAYKGIMTMFVCDYW